MPSNINNRLPQPTNAQRWAARNEAGQTKEDVIAEVREKSLQARMGETVKVNQRKQNLLERTAEFQAKRAGRKAATAATEDTAAATDQTSEATTTETDTTKDKA